MDKINTRDYTKVFNLLKIEAKNKSKLPVFCFIKTKRRAAKTDYGNPPITKGAKDHSQNSVRQTHFESLTQMSCVPHWRTGRGVSWQGALVHFTLLLPRCKATVSETVAFSPLTMKSFTKSLKKLENILNSSFSGSWLIRLLS